MWLDMVAAINSNFGKDVDLSEVRRDFPNKKLQKLLPSAETTRVASMHHIRGLGELKDGESSLRRA